MTWRGSAFILILAAAVFGVGSGAAVSEQSRSLREAAQGAGMLIGAAVRPAQLSEAAYAATLAREFNMVEPEDTLKWEMVHPERESFDFSEADKVVDFAIRHGMKVRGHTLVWHRQDPKWLTEGTYTSSELAEILEKHIRTVVGHYRGKIFAWDVVNEAFDEVHAGELRDTIWRDQPGIGVAEKAAASHGLRAASSPARSKLAGRGLRQSYSYIEQCFRWAHDADPQALLFYNEAEAEGVNLKSDAVYAMVRDFRQRGVPIDGVGLQMHIANLHADVASISANIKRFTALGVQVHITEMDVALAVDAGGKARAEDLERQAEIYREIASACLAHRGCTAIQTWGFTDKYSWIGSHSKHTQGAALPFDGDYRAKPAYGALRNALEGAQRRSSVVDGRSSFVQDRCSWSRVVVATGLLPSFARLGRARSPVPTLTRPHTAPPTPPVLRLVTVESPAPARSIMIVGLSRQRYLDNNQSSSRRKQDLGPPEGGDRAGDWRVSAARHSGRAGLI